MYVSPNFKTKKALKAAVQAWNEYQEFAKQKPFTVGAVLASRRTALEPVTVFQPGPFRNGPQQSGVATIEGPHFPEPHKWYATVTIKDGCVVSVK